MRVEGTHRRKSVILGRLYTVDFSFGGDITNLALTEVTTVPTVTFSRMKMGP